MKRNNSTSRFGRPFLILIGYLIALLCSANMAAAGDDTESNSERILFLHLIADSTGISLVDQLVVEGSLKRPQGLVRSHGLGVAVLDGNGAIQFEQIVKNPLIDVYEYEDPDNPGELKMKVVERDQAEFWVRVPLTQSTDRIRFQLEDRRSSAPAPKLDSRLSSELDLSFLKETN